MSINDIPALNAALNALATVLMTAGFLCIRNVPPGTGLSTPASRWHGGFMLSAGVVSAIFLVGYVSHKILVHGVHTPFGGEGAIRIFYYVMLLTHILLAMSIAVLVPATFRLALKRRYEQHRRWARWTYPIWYYVSVTGVLVYFFLYQWWPST